MALTSPRRSKQELLARAGELEQTTQALERRLEMLREEVSRRQDELRHLEGENGRLAAQNERLDLLVKLDKHMQSLNLDKIFEVCITRVPYLLNAHSASVYLYDELTGKLHLKRHSHDRAIEHVIDTGEGATSLMAQSVRTRKVQVFQDLDAPEGAHGAAGGAGSAERPHRDRYASRSCIVAPLAIGDRVVGVLNLSDPIDEKPFSDSDDYRLVAQVAEMLALGIANCQRFAELEERAKADSLTRLVNHQTFFELLDRELQRAVRYGGDLTVVMIDVDAFKVTNDNAGHLAGDFVLREVARRITESIRVSDTAARYGGDEFALILPQSDLAAAAVVAERLRARVAGDPVTFEGRELRARVSLGLAQLEGGLGASDLVRRADQALYRAKRAGGDRVVTHPLSAPPAGAAVPAAGADPGAGADPAAPAPARGAAEAAKAAAAKRRGGREGRQRP